MKTFKNLGLFMLILILQSCNSDDGVNANALPLPETLANLFESNLSSKFQIATFDANSNFTFTSEKGVTLNLTAGALRLNGAPVSGLVKLEFIEIFNKADMLITNKPTMGKTPSGESRLLYSGGEFFIRVTQDAKDLTYQGFYNLRVPTALTGGTDAGMLPFDGTINTNEDLVWEQSLNAELFVNPGQATIPAFYNVFNSNFGWFNCDRFANYTGDKTTITVLVPAGYAAVSQIFLTTKNVPNSLGKSYGTFPVGLECSVIFVTEKDGKFRYAIKPVEALQVNHTVNFSLAETTIGTKDQFVIAINAIP
jgi:hypothetical protein